MVQFWVCTHGGSRAPHFCFQTGSSEGLQFKTFCLITEIDLWYVICSLYWNEAAAHWVLHEPITAHTAASTNQNSTHKDEKKKKKNKTSRKKLRFPGNIMLKGWGLWYHILISIDHWLVNELVVSAALIETFYTFISLKTICKLLD